MESDCSRLVLGTAQLGVDYGVANACGKPSAEKAVSIVKTALDGGICMFDTAHAYGKSESVLGQAFSVLNVQNQVKIVTKFPFDQALDEASLFSSVDAARTKLGVPSLHTILFHRDDILDVWPNVKAGIGALKESGYVQHVGVSTYEPDRAFLALKSDGLDAVQVPASILDRRYESAGFFESARNVQVYVRSVFLQGLLLMKSDSIPESLGFTREVVRGVQALAEKAGLARDEAALAYVRDRWPGVRVLVGAETVDQIRRNIDIWESTSLTSEQLAEFENGVGVVEERVVRPDQWPSQ